MDTSALGNMLSQLTLPTPAFPPKRTHPAAILYVEDDFAQARLMQRSLARQGFVVEHVSNGPDALLKLNEENYAVVLVDFSLPGMDGLEILRRMAQLEDSPPCIMITGQGNEYVAVEAMKLGAFDYIVKDFNTFYLQLMSTILERVMRQAQQNREYARARQALQESEARFHAMADAAPVQIWVADAQGAVLFINQRIVQFLGESAPVPGELIWSRSIHPDDRSGYTRCVTHALEQHASFEIEVRLQSANGEYHWFLESGVPCTEGASFAGLIGTGIDVTQQKLIEAQHGQAIDALSRSCEHLQALFQLLPICSHCKRVRDRHGKWQTLETYTREQLGTDFSHGICPDCSRELYPEVTYGNAPGD